MLLPVIFWVLGIVAGRHLALPAFWYLGFATVFFVGALWVKGGRNALILLLFLLFGALRYHSIKDDDALLKRILAEKRAIRGVVEYRVERKLGQGLYLAEVESLGMVEMRGQVFFHCEEEVEPGAKYRGLSFLQPMWKDNILNIYPQNSVGRMRALLPPEMVEGGKRGVVAEFRQWVEDRLDKALGLYSPMAKALILGDSVYKKESSAALSRAGITHLIVVSGLHVLMLSFVLMTLLRMLLPKAIAEVAFIFALLGFAALNNWAPPIMRAMIMIDIVLVGRFLGRVVKLKQSLAVALFIITLANPLQLFDIGLQLSFICVAIIIFALPSLKLSSRQGYVKRGMKAFANYLLLSFSVALGTFPISLYYFGTASLNGLVGNLLGIPLVYLNLLLALFTLAFPFKPLILSYKAVCDLFDWWLEFSSSLPLYIQDSWLSLSETFALACVIILLFTLMKGKYKPAFRLSPFVAVVVALVALFPVRPKDELYIFNAGVADCALIFDGRGKATMIDTGGVKGSKAEISILKAAEGQSWLKKELYIRLKRKRVKSIEHLIISHLHSDHAGGLADALSSLKVNKLYLPESELNSEVWKELKEGLNLSKTEVCAVSDTFSLSLGENRLRFLHPSKGYEHPNINNNSLVCRYDTPKGSFLFTADIQGEAEEFLVQNYPDKLKADVLKVPHHGSRSSSTGEFLDLVRPVEAVFTTSLSNLYGFPHQEALSRYQTRDILIKYSYEGSLRYRLR